MLYLALSKELIFVLQKTAKNKNKKTKTKKPKEKKPKQNKTKNHKIKTKTGLSSLRALKLAGVLLAKTNDSVSRRREYYKAMER
ncbi:MAG: hypothetical protein LBC41_03575 [Clostridiales bacterium]|jgi:hypothetical protein|nr:hypothetical protein [Clostridiales bacterium]